MSRVKCVLCCLTCWFIGVLLNEVLLMLSQNLTDGSRWKSMVTSNEFKWAWGPELARWGLECTSVTFQFDQCWSRGGSHHQHTGGMGRTPTQTFYFQELQLLAGKREKKRPALTFSPPLLLAVTHEGSELEAWRSLSICTFWTIKTM